MDVEFAHGDKPMVETVITPDPLIIHHAGCVDGFVGALLFWLAYGGRGEYRPAQYGNPAPTDDEVLGRDVRIVDFSYPREELERIARSANSVWVLDHHKTAAENCLGLDFCVFDMDRSGAMLAFDVLEETGALAAGLAKRCSSYPGEPATSAFVDALTRRLVQLVRYVQDRDLWRWRLECTREVSAALASYPRKSIYECAEWWREHVLFEPISSHYAEGTGILRMQARQVEQLASHAWWAGMDDLVLAVVNCPLLQSEVGEHLLASPTHRADVAVMWWQKSDGRYVYSLRSAEGGPDVAAMAQAHGGGGHEHAAGFVSERPPQELVASMSGEVA